MFGRSSAIERAIALTLVWLFRAQIFFTELCVKSPRCDGSDDDQGCTSSCNAATAAVAQLFYAHGSREIAGAFLGCGQLAAVDGVVLDHRCRLWKPRLRPPLLCLLHRIQKRQPTVGQGSLSLQVIAGDCLGSFEPIPFRIWIV